MIDNEIFVQKLINYFVFLCFHMSKCQCLFNVLPFCWILVFEMSHFVECFYILLMFSIWNVTCIKLLNLLSFCLCYLFIFLKYHSHSPCFDDSIMPLHLITSRLGLKTSYCLCSLFALKNTAYNDHVKFGTTTSQTVVVKELF